MAGELVRIRRADFEAGRLTCANCRAPVDPKKAVVSYAPITSWDPISGGDRRTEDAFASLSCPSCDEVLKLNFLLESDG
jgi:hypothetical protein